MKQLLKGGIVVSGKQSRRLDVLIEDGVIVETALDIDSKGVEVIDVTNKYLFPGFIDTHTHFKLEVAGTVTADDFETGTKAAIVGGTTLILDFATQNKGETLKEAIENWHKKSDGISSCDYGFHLAISDWNEKVSKELEEVIRGGISSFKIYMTYDAMVVDDKEIYQILKRLKELGGIAGVHCENKGIIEGLIEDEKAAGHLGLKSHAFTRPAAAEAEAVDRLLKIAEVVDTAVIVVHLSSEEGYKEICAAREKGQEVVVETCPQYLLLDESKYSLEGFEGAKYIIAPPLRTLRDQNQLWSAIKEGQIQTIGTDHCSFTFEQKKMGEHDFTKIPGGMPGVETRAVLFYTYGVLERGLTMEDMCRLLSENAAKLYGVYPKKGCIAPGSDADIVVWNTDSKRILTKETQLANVDYNPYEGFAVQGIAERVYLRGQLTAEKGEIVKANTGCYVARTAPMSLE